MYLLKTKNYQLKTTRGFTLVEFLVTLVVLMLLVGVLTRLQTDIFSLYGTSRDSITVEHDIREFERMIIAELRAAQSSDLGGYPIAEAATSSITFYSDLDANGTREQVRYFLSGSKILKAVTVSSGVPLQYSSGSEVLSTAAYNLIATTTPIFSYYAAGYAPTTQALPIPVDIKSIRLIKVTVAADVNPVRSPGVITGTSEVTIRNLKDNL